MTREEAIEDIRDNIKPVVGGISLDMAIKALGQQPCEDCISRQAVEEMIKAEMPERGMWEIEGDKEKETVCEVCVDLMQKLSDLPSVTPTRPTGQWFVDERPESDREVVCSNCDNPIFKYHKLGFDYRPKYCPNCGARMAESEEEK